MAAKLLFNIGRIPARQSGEPVSDTATGKSCRWAGKGRPMAAPSLAGHSNKQLKYMSIFL
jgi:hypothetical protein